MAVYGMRDAANLTLVNKKTGNIDLFIDYANATSSEWTAERVFANKKGTQAIAWDTGRTGTLTIESEMFDLGYLAMILGSEVEKGTNQIIKREVFTVEDGRGFKLDGDIDSESVSVIKLKEDELEHDGMPIQSTTGQFLLLPEIARNVNVAANDTSAIVTFEDSEKAVEYEIRKNGAIVATVAGTSYTDTGLSAETTYTYTVTAVNQFGSAPVSAVVEAQTAVAGVTTRSNFKATPEDIAEAEGKQGELVEAVANAVTFSYAGNIVQLNEKAVIGDKYAVFYMENVSGVRTIDISADKFPGSYEVFADAMIRDQDTGADSFVQIHYKNARPQSNFTLTQNATEPTSLSVVFDLFPDNKNSLGEFKVVD